MLTLEQLGITNEDLIERVVERLVDNFLGDGETDEFGYQRTESITKSVKTIIEERVSTSVKKVCEEHVIPKVEEMIKGLVIQETNAYGEKRGKQQSFVEFAVARAEAYLQQNVNYNGEGQTEKDSYGWKPDATRLVFLVKKQISADIEKAVKESLTNCTKQIAESLAEVTKIKLKEAAQKLRMDVSV